MPQKSRVILLCIAAAFVITCFVIIAHRHRHILSKSEKPLPIWTLTRNHINQDYVDGTGERPLKKFAYLTQTESCLYEYLQAPQQLGNSTNCQCEVLVLSYKKVCKDTSLPHVEYIFDADSTWTTGRNLLYRTIMKREQKYLYYTFFDDDIQLIFREKPKEDLNPWREYEKALLQMRPPIAVSWELRIQERFGKYYRGECNYSKKTDFLPFLWYNALFNSFHREIVSYLLPYCEKWNSISEWYSQVYCIIKTDLMFPGQVYHHVNILARNPQHRPYKQAYFGSKEVKAMLDTFIENELPIEYKERLQPKFQDWVANIRKKEFMKDQCPVFPSNLGVNTESIVPFAYLNS